jgi:hypothetical protein
LSKSRITPGWTYSDSAIALSFNRKESASSSLFIINLIFYPSTFGQKTLYCSMWLRLNINHNPKPSISMFLHAAQKMPCAILVVFNFFRFMYSSFHPLLLDGSLFKHAFEMFVNSINLDIKPL